MTCHKETGPTPRIHYDDAFSASGLPIAGDCPFDEEQGNRMEDPQFVAGKDGARWKLSPNSPLVEQGDNDAIGHLHRDIRGVPRIVDGGHGLVVDMGAYEHLPK